MIISLDSPPRSHATYTPIQRRRARGRSHLSAPRRSRPVHVEDTPPESDNPDKPTIPKKYIIRFDKAYIEAVLQGYESKGHLTLKFDRLKYHPFLVSRDPKPPGTIAMTALTNDAPTSSSLQSLDPDPDTIEIRTPEDTDPEVINHGQDKATLALVAKLSEPEGLRSLRKRPASNPPASSEGKRRRTRSGSGVGAGILDTPRRSLRGAVNSPLKDVATTVAGVEGDDADADGEWEIDAEGEDVDLDLDLDAEGEVYVEE